MKSAVNGKEPEKYWFVFETIYFISASGFVVHTLNFLLQYVMSFFKNASIEPISKMNGSTKRYAKLGQNCTAQAPSV